MNRISIIDHKNANAEQRKMLNAIQSSQGMVSNLLKVFVNSPVALKAFLGLQVISNTGSLSPQTRVRIALAIAEQYSNEYCLSLHTISGRKVGLTGNEMTSNRNGSSEDARASIAIRLALSLSKNMGDISTFELIEAREAGYRDADIVEIISHVGMHLLANMLSKASNIDIDLQEVEPLYTNLTIPKLESSS
jgi:AhpD family alkylhydroperoxidase